jgi:hypothetical protein
MVLFSPGAVRWRRSGGQNAASPALFMHLGNLTTFEPCPHAEGSVGEAAGELCDEDGAAQARVKFLAGPSSGVRDSPRGAIEPSGPTFSAEI